MSGFITLLYGLSYPFYAPFHGLLKPIGQGDVVFETSTFVAIVIIFILDFASDRLLNEIFKDDGKGKQPSAPAPSGQTAFPVAPQPASPQQPEVAQSPAAQPSQPTVSVNVTTQQPTQTPQEQTTGAFPAQPEVQPTAQPQPVSPPSTPQQQQEPPKPQEPQQITTDSDRSPLSPMA
jgi:hypothetical protein